MASLTEDLRANYSRNIRIQRRNFCKGQEYRCTAAEFIRLPEYSLTTPTIEGMISDPFKKVWKCNLFARFGLHQMSCWIICQYIPSEKEGYISVKHMMPIIRLPLHAQTTIN